jgi:uncharacterized membrane protein HdeD (DUF308 family)
MNTIQSLLSNWKTTSAGLTMIIGGIIHLVYAIKSHALTEGDCTTTVLAIITGCGFIAAGDANVKPPTAPPAPPAP